jgi:hypothetical protein
MECVATLGFRGEPAKAENTYTFNLRAAHQAVTETGKPLQAIISKLNEIRHEYLAGCPDLLFYPPTVPADLGFVMKPFQSAIHKMYRQNVIFNKRYPDPPPDGGIDPSRMYEEIDDLVRARIVCKYLDGPRFVCERLSQHCSAAGINFNYRDLSTDAGYYAWHFYFQSPVELMLNGEVQNRFMWIEVQLTTQLAEVITSLTHGLYAERREGHSESRRGDWKWDAASQRFRSAYLGHGLHLLEGIIQTFRDERLGTAAGAANAGVLEVEEPTQKLDTATGDHDLALPKGDESQ